MIFRGIFVRVYVYDCECVCVHDCECVCVSVCVYVCVGVCVYVFDSLSVFHSVREHNNFQPIMQTSTNFHDKRNGHKVARNVFLSIRRNESNVFPPLPIFNSRFLAFLSKILIAIYHRFIALLILFRHFFYSNENDRNLVTRVINFIMERHA